jgi:hypothetical protein
MHCGLVYWTVSHLACPFPPLLPPPPAFASTTASVSTTAVGYVLLVGHRSCECGDLVGQGLDLCGRCVCRCLRAVADVGCLFFLGNCCLQNPSNILAQFIATVGIGCLVCAFVVVFANCPAAVLLGGPLEKSSIFLLQTSFLVLDHVYVCYMTSHVKFC